MMRSIDLCTGDYGDAFYERELMYLEPRKRDRALSYKTERDRKCCILGDYAMRYLVSEIAGCPIEDVRISSDDKGCPFVLRPLGTGLYCSVSHSGMHVAALVSNAPAGIDTEMIDEPDMELASRVFTPGELKYLEQNGDDGFYRIWTVKEAYLKCIGTGITDLADLADTDALDLPAGYISEILEDRSGYITAIVRKEC
jgi:4'-phosphopantetheinyl transferase